MDLREYHYDMIKFRGLSEHHHELMCKHFQEVMDELGSVLPAGACANTQGRGRVCTLNGPQIQVLHILLSGLQLKGLITREGAWPGSIVCQRIEIVPTLIPTVNCSVQGSSLV